MALSAREHYHTIYLLERWISQTFQRIGLINLENSRSHCENIECVTSVATSMYKALLLIITIHCFKAMNTFTADINVPLVRTGICKPITLH